MKKLIGILAGVLVSAAVVMAGSPARVTGSVATTGTTFLVPASGSTAYRLQNVTYGYATAAGATQAVVVAVVQSGITNQIATKTVTAATDIMLTMTNAPWLFDGDGVRITTTATNAASAVLVGETED